MNPDQETTIEHAVRIARHHRRRDGILVATIQIPLQENGQINARRFQTEVDLKEAIARSREPK